MSMSVSYSSCSSWLRLCASVRRSSSSSPRARSIMPTSCCRRCSAACSSWAALDESSDCSTCTSLSALRSLARIAVRASSFSSTSRPARLQISSSSSLAWMSPCRSSLASRKSSSISRRRSFSRATSSESAKPIMPPIGSAWAAPPAAAAPVGTPKYCAACCCSSLSVSFSRVSSCTRLSRRSTCSLAVAAASASAPDCADSFARRTRISFAHT
mmetsp:Transcript_37948/g.117274  ORF Transcript_37948/g.117274 Transcript_37948/m.117274 type:complete len:214 (+) Transcript_37948:781-1422(+)